MRKPDSLREFLTKTVPTIADNPDRLHIFIDQGRVAATGTPSPSFEYRYRLNLVVEDFARDPDMLMIPLLVWIATNQPQLLENGHEPFKFDADILANDKVDISIELELAEVAVVTPKDGGGFEVTHPAEPVYAAPFEGVPDTVQLWQIELEDHLVANPQP